MGNMIELTMEVDGMLMVVVAEYCYYGPQSVQLESVMDRDGEPVDPGHQERGRLYRQINAKHTERR